MILTATAANRPAKPNIILMMADDMGLGDTSAYLGTRLMGNAPPVAKTLRTPNLAAFSNQAMVFTDAHAPASMCSSTRYALLTGRFFHRAYLKNQGWLAGLFVFSPVGPTGVAWSLHSRHPSCSLS
ncbi:MAG: sulfatase-like hydrolase/transferase [Verrucomicrobiia bacterium]